MGFRNIDNEKPDAAIVSGPGLRCEICPTSNPEESGKFFESPDPEESFFSVRSQRIRTIKNYRQIYGCLPYVQAQFGIAYWSSGGCGVSRIKKQAKDANGEDREYEEGETIEYQPTARHNNLGDERVVGYTKTAPCPVSDLLDCYNPCGGEDEPECQSGTLPPEDGEEEGEAYSCVDCGARPPPVAQAEEPEEDPAAEALEEQLAGLEESLENLREKHAKAYSELGNRYLDVLNDDPYADWSDAFSALSESQYNEEQKIFDQMSAARQAYADAKAKEAEAREKLKTACEKAAEEAEEGDEVSAECQQFQSPAKKEPTGYRTSEMKFTARFGVDSDDDDDDDDDSSDDDTDDGTKKLKCIKEYEYTRTCSTSTTCGGTETVYTNWSVENGADQYSQAGRAATISYNIDEVYTTASRFQIKGSILEWSNQNSFAGGRSVKGEEPKVAFKIHNLCHGIKYVFGYDIFSRDWNSDDDWQREKTERKEFTAVDYTKKFGSVIEDPEDEFYESDGETRLSSEDRRKAEKSNWDNLGSVSGLPIGMNKEYMLCNVAVISSIAYNEDWCPTWREGISMEEDDDPFGPIPDGFGEEDEDSFQGE